MTLGIAGVAMNLHVSSAVDALSSLGRGERRTFYAMLAVMAAVLPAAALNRQPGPADGAKAASAPPPRPGPGLLVAPILRT